MGIVAVSLLAGAPAAVAAPEPQAKSQGTAQTVTGEVLDAAGEPLIGASIRVKETKQAVVSDIDGRFTVKAPMGATLVLD